MGFGDGVHAEPYTRELIGMVSSTYTLLMIHVFCRALCCDRMRLAAAYALYTVHTLGVAVQATLS